MARVMSNPRVVEAMVDCEKLLLDDAKTMSYRDFEIVVRQFERLADHDGAEPKAEGSYKRRRAWGRFDFDGG